MSVNDGMTYMVCDDTNNHDINDIDLDSPLLTYE